MKGKSGRKPKCGRAMRRKISVRISDKEYHALLARAGESNVTELVREKVADLLRI